MNGIKTIFVYKHSTSVTLSPWNGHWDWVEAFAGPGHTPEDGEMHDNHTLPSRNRIRTLVSAGNRPAHSYISSGRGEVVKLLTHPSPTHCIITVAPPFFY